MSAGFRLVVLGVAQDGGLPHVGCECARCASARQGERPREKVACLGLTDGERGWLFDATPDLPAQLHALGTRRPDGIFLTHAHMGHYTGLVHLGREALGAEGVVLHATPSMAAFLSANAPWNALLASGAATLDTSGDVELGGVRVTAFPVPHRQEYTDTVGYRIEGPRASALFIPDIDSWDAWDRDLRAEVESVDVAYLDATFFSADELPNRNQAEIPHPLVPDTMARLAGLGGRVRLIHLNHTNPVWDDPSLAAPLGFRRALEGDVFEI